MVRRLALVLACLSAVLLGSGLAGTSGGTAPAAVILAVTPPYGVGTVHRVLTAHGLPPSAGVPVVIYAPGGTQSVLLAESSAGGDVLADLTPPSGFTLNGIYRAVIGLNGGEAQSTVFAVGTQTAQLQVTPPIFSPFSAMQILGSGLPPNEAFDLTLTLSDDRGDRLISVSTDGNGFFSAYVWPRQLGVSFFEAGLYRVSLPGLKIATDFQVREEPIGATIAVDGPALGGIPTFIHFRRYTGNRYLWTVLADSSGRVLGEMLYGTTDPSGSLDVRQAFSGLDAGAYLLATPYEWGETTFTFIPPTATPTATPTLTPTATPTATATPTPHPRTKKVCKRKHGKRVCKRVPVGPGL